MPATASCRKLNTALTYGNENHRNQKVSSNYPSGTEQRLPRFHALLLQRHIARFTSLIHFIVGGFGAGRSRIDGGYDDGGGVCCFSGGHGVTIGRKMRGVVGFVGSVGESFFTS